MSRKYKNWLTNLVYVMSLKSALKNINLAINAVHRTEKYLECARVDVDFFDDVDRLYCRRDDIEKLLSDNTELNHE